MHSVIQGMGNVFAQQGGWETTVRMNVRQGGMEKTANTSASVKLMQYVILQVESAFAPLDIEVFIVICHVKGENGEKTAKKLVDAEMEGLVIMKLENVYVYQALEENNVK